MAQRGRVTAARFLQLLSLSGFVPVLLLSETSARGAPSSGAVLLLLGLLSVMMGLALGERVARRQAPGRLWWVPPFQVGLALIQVPFVLTFQAPLVIGILWLMRSDLQRALLERRPPLLPFDFRVLPSSRPGPWLGLIATYLVMGGVYLVATNRGGADH